MNLRKLFPRSSNIYETFKPFQLSLKVFGFSPFTLDGNRDVVFGFLDFILMMASLLWLIYCLLSNLRPPNPSLYRSEQLQIGWQLLLLSEISACFVIVLMNFNKRKTIAKILKTLHEVDENPNMEGVNHSKHYFESVVMIFSCGLFFTLVFAFAIYVHGWKKVDLYLIVSYIYISQSYNLIIYQFLFGAYCVKSRFQCINDHLE